LANGKPQTRAFAYIWAEISDQKEQGLAILEPSPSELLIGLEFLRVFRLGLFLTSARFALIDEVAFTQFIAAQGSISAEDAGPIAMDQPPASKRRKRRKP
jgi:hypothetical protein